MVFERIKRAMIEEHVHALPGHRKKFEVQNDVSNYSIEGYLCR